MQELPLTKTPRPYQQEFVDWFIKEAQSRAINADEMGLGKTCEAYLAWRALGYPMPCLILAGVNAQVTWAAQAKDWGCPAPNRIRGTPAERAHQWSKYGKGLTTTTREALKRDIKSGVVKPEQFKFVIVDEAHKDSNRKVGNWRLIKSLFGNSTKGMLLSGSASRRGNQNLWGLLHVVRPWQYKSFYQFIDKYCEIDKEGPFGWEILGPKNEEGLQRELAKIMIRRTKKLVRPDMPPKTRDLDSNVLVMTPGQQELYRNISEDAVAELAAGGYITAPNLLAKILRLRQVLVTPKLLDPNAEDGAGIDRVVEMLDEADDKHMCIFSPFAAALPHVQKRLVAEGHDPGSIIQLSGGLSVEELVRRIDVFRARRGICICSIRYAESFDLIPATWGVFLGYEWDAWDNLQAEDRLHRGEIVDPVTLYYISHSGGIDRELMLGALDTKVNNVMQVLGNMERVRQMLKANIGRP